MPTAEEIERRVKDNDTARSARRSAAAAQVGELAQRRNAIAEQLAAIERELGDIVAGASDVIEVDELARFTDVPADDLNRWLTNRKPTRGKRKRAAASAANKRSDDENKDTMSAKEPIPSQPFALPESSAPETSVRVASKVP